jgi:hypothetical protein
MPQIPVPAMKGQAVTSTPLTTSCAMLKANVPVLKLLGPNYSLLTKTNASLELIEAVQK